jgi:hypothetical protein
MTYGLDCSQFVENGPENTASQARATFSTARSWFALDPDLRLELIEQALRAPANDVIDAFPLAL